MHAGYRGLREPALAPKMPDLPVDGGELAKVDLCDRRRDAGFDVGPTAHRVSIAARSGGGPPYAAREVCTQVGMTLARQP